MPPAFALSQDQTLRFIQASPCNQSHTATPKRTSKGSSLSPNTSQPTSNNQAPSQNTQNRYPLRNTHPGADRASHPATHRNKAKTHRNKAQHQPSKDSQALSTSKKTRCNCQTTKKEPATEHLTASPIAGPLNSTNHRQGKNTSRSTSASQAQITNNLAVNGLLVPSTKHVKRLSTPETRRQRPARPAAKRRWPAPVRKMPVPLLDPGR